MEKHLHSPNEAPELNDHDLETVSAGYPKVVVQDFGMDYGDWGPPGGGGYGYGYGYGSGWGSSRRWSYRRWSYRSWGRRRRFWW